MIVTKSHFEHTLTNRSSRFDGFLQIVVPLLNSFLLQAFDYLQIGIRTGPEVSSERILEQKHDFIKYNSRVEMKG